ncbi:MAG: DUF4846 domain-containing protein [Saprospiraceae bacterium]|nr:DUF4846 domain-containing protein [Saprospiraceae bacterium]
MKIKALVLFASSLLSCQNTPQAPPQYRTDKIGEVEENIDIQSVSGIPLPQGYERLPVADNSFAGYLSQIKIKKDKTVYLFDGRKKTNQTAQYAVLDVSVGNRDLQQCADAVMRLRGEYLFAQKKYDKIAFHSVSGENMRFMDWANGARNLLTVKTLTTKLKPNADVSHENFLKYMNFVFAYASTLSLSKEMTPLSKTSDIEAGDVFIKGGSPGHAVIVVDVARHKTTGKKIFLLAQSYMPAQDIHILKNPSQKTLSPWYEQDFEEVLQTPEWDFDKTALKKF